MVLADSEWGGFLKAFIFFRPPISEYARGVNWGFSQRIRGVNIGLQYCLLITAIYVNHLQRLVYIGRF